MPTPLTNAEKRQITKNIAEQIWGFIKKRCFDVGDLVLNKKIDKVEFGFTFGGQHFWLVLLREPKKL